MLPSLTPWSFARGLRAILAAKPRVPPSLEANALLGTILSRRSVRRFRTDPIPDEVFTAILEAGRMAPSTVNLQTWSFALFDPATWQEAFGQGIPFRGARAVIVLADTSRVRGVLDAFPESALVEYTIGVMNASLAAMAMNLAAEALGVSSVMLSETGRTGILDIAYLRERLGLPERVIPLMTLVFGFAAGRYPPMPPRLPIEVITFEGRYHPAPAEVMSTWLEQMMVGYAASHPGASLEEQLRVYTRKLQATEVELRRTAGVATEGSRSTATL